MRVSHRWLCELVPDLDAAPERVAEKLTSAGLEVEQLRRFGAGLEDVRVAEVRRIETHPKRERLRLVTVSLGDGEQRVVCGAPNVPEPGGLVAFAPEGVHLPGLGVTLAARDIGGVESRGMIVSEAEMGLSEAAEGIVVLPAGVAPPGARLPEALPACQDALYEVGITPNRPDALGHVGLAREVAALFGLSFAAPSVGEPRRGADTEVESLIRVDNLDPERCPHYGAALVDQVTVAPSPDWLRWRLYSLGIRPISNVVDVTNLLLLEYGQPMHAFDFDLVREARITIRRAKAGEPFTTLDGVRRTLDEDDLVICDGVGPTALAGVMGGESSEIRSSTRRVLLECAYFSPRGVRRTARRHGLQTESSYRFERGVDWAQVPDVLERAKVLLTELAGGRAISGSIHARGAPLERRVISLRSKRIDALLGVSVPFDEALSVLRRLGFEVRERRLLDGEDVAQVVAPSWRPDIEREVDLIEEVARVRGFDRIPTRLPAIAPQDERQTGKLERQVAAEAVALGLSEAVTYAFVSHKELTALGAPDPIVLLENPLSEERAVMRTSLLPGLLEVLRHARRHGERQVRVFAVGSVFLQPPQTPEPARSARPRRPGDETALPEERPAFAAVLAGPRPAYLSKVEDVDVYDAKGIAVELVERLTGRRATVEHAREGLPHLHPRGAARIKVDGATLGSLGSLHPNVADALDLDGIAQIIELDLAALETVGGRTPRYHPIPRLPAIARDVALVVGEEVLAGDIEGVIVKAAGDLCESVELFDVFTGETISAGRRSLAFRVVYRDPKASIDPESARTLTDREVDERHERVRAALREIGDLRA